MTLVTEYQQARRAGDASAMNRLGDALERLDRVISSELGKARPRSGRADRLTGLRRSLGWARSEVEAILEQASLEPPGSSRDELVQRRIVEVLNRVGPTDEADVRRAIKKVQREVELDTASGTKDWVRGLNGPSDTAGMILETVGRVQGWMGASHTNTQRLREAVTSSAYPEYTRDSAGLETLAAVLRAVGCPAELLPVTTAMLALMLGGTRAELCVERDTVDRLLRLPKMVLPPVTGRPDADQWVTAVDGAQNWLQHLRKKVAATNRGVVADPDAKAVWFDILTALTRSTVGGREDLDEGKGEAGTCGDDAHNP